LSASSYSNSGTSSFSAAGRGGWEIVGKGQSRTIIDIKPLLHPIQDVGREIDVKDLRFVGRLDTKATDDLSVRLRKNVEAMIEQHPVGFDPHEVFTIGNEHR
jgi:hypothetical protein